MITAEQLRDELNKVIEAGNGDKEVKIQSRGCWESITGFYYVGQNWLQTTDPAKIGFTTLEFTELD